MMYSQYKMNYPNLKMNYFQQSMIYSNLLYIFNCFSCFIVSF